MDDQDFDDVMADDFAPENMDAKAWELVRSLARAHFLGGEKNYCKCAIMAYFDFLELSCMDSGEKH